MPRNACYELRRRRWRRYCRPAHRRLTRSLTEASRYLRIGGEAAVKLVGKLCVRTHWLRQLRFFVFCSVERRCGAGTVTADRLRDQAAFSIETLINRRMTESDHSNAYAPLNNLYLNHIPWLSVRRYTCVNSTCSPSIGFYICISAHGIFITSFSLGRRFGISLDSSLGFASLDNWTNKFETTAIHYQFGN